jgi:uncharacterized protein YcbK (DUF882 family)
LVLTGSLLGLAVLACSMVATAQPPARVKRTASKSVSVHASSVQPNAAAATAYVAGEQALVGWHSTSTREVTRDATGKPMLSLTTLNRGESLTMAATCDHGGFYAADLDRAAHLLRAGSGDEHPIDPRTLSLVYQIETHFAVPEIRVVSAYRVPRGGSRSNHAKGRAIDIVVPGVPDEEVARFVRGMGFVGVGIYPSSQFVHVDIRPRSYFWVDYSAPHARNRERGILGDLATKSDAAALARGESPIEPFAVATDVDGLLRARALVLSAPASEEDEDEEN